MADPLALCFVRTLEPALRQAAAIARALEGRVANRPKQGERSPAKAALTLADTASQEALLVPLLQDFAAACLEAEERTPSVDAFTGEATEQQIVVDPIDGTLSFYLRGAGPYAVMAGLALRGRYEAALVALPRERLFLEAVRGAGARVARGGGSFEPASLPGSGREVLVSDNLPEAVADRLRGEGYGVRPAAGGAIAVAPLLPGVCAGLRLAGAAGAISRRGRIGVLIASEAGALVRGAAGAPFPEAIDAPAPALLTAARPEDLDALQRALDALA